MYSSEEDLQENYQKFFELGLYKKDSPACKVFAGVEVCPIVLAAMVTALFETVMKAVEESQQIEFEKRFLQSLQIMFEERFDYDVVTQEFED